MQTINLRDFYPLYNVDTFVDVPDEVLAALLEAQRLERNYIRRTFNTKRRSGEFIGSFAPYGYSKDGEINHNDYRHMSEDYERQVEAAKTVIGNLKMEQAEIETSMDTEIPFLTVFGKYENIRQGKF